jgi:ATP-dependent RNA helicase RhlE
MHGDLSQAQRNRTLQSFRAGRTEILVATDVVGRGIDVPGISHVINYELPDDPENYVHRIGRTARNGASGVAITLCDGTERGKLRDVERLIRRTLPTTGELKGPIVDAPTHRDRAAKPAPARPQGERKHAKAGRHFSGAKKATIVAGRRGNDAAPRPAVPAAESASGPAWWERPTGQGTPAPKSKQRWNKARKDAARGRRAADPRAERVTG